MNLPDTLTLVGQFSHSDNLLVHDNDRYLLTQFVIFKDKWVVYLGMHERIKMKLFFDC